MDESSNEYGTQRWRGLRQVHALLLLASKSSAVAGYLTPCRDLFYPGSSCILPQRPVSGRPGLYGGAGVGCEGETRAG